MKKIEKAEDIYEMCDDWRIMGQPGYLFKKMLVHRRFEIQPGEKADHAHCEFCNDYFSLNENYLHEGYYEPKSQTWICEECFQDFREMFQWEV